MNKEFWRIFFTLFLGIIGFIILFFGIIYLALNYLGDFWGGITLFTLFIALICGFLAYIGSRL